MAFQQPPDEGSDTSFWASVFKEEPPNVLCGVLTDLNLHRFTLHQHLTTNEPLTETPLLHQPLRQALPPPLQRHVQRYHTNLNLANVHLQRALDALDHLGRQPPSAYLRNPDLATQPPPRHHSQQPVVYSLENLFNFHRQSATTFPPYPDLGPAAYFHADYTYAFHHPSNPTNRHFDQPSHL